MPPGDWSAPMSVRARVIPDNDASASGAFRARLREGAADPGAAEGGSAPAGGLRRAMAIPHRLANDQHYEVPPRFFELCLGRRKYSCCLPARHRDWTGRDDAGAYAERAPSSPTDRPCSNWVAAGAHHALWMAGVTRQARRVQLAHSAIHEAIRERGCQRAVLPVT
jgi:hypothetical protein